MVNLRFSHYSRYRSYIQTDITEPVFSQLPVSSAPGVSLQKARSWDEGVSSNSPPLLSPKSSMSALDPIPASWNLVIRGYSQGSHPREAVALFVEMKRGTRPNKLTFPFLLKACSQLSDLQREKQIQADVVKNGVDSNIYIQNTLMRFYGSCKEISDARRVFDGMCFRTVVSWNSIIFGYVENSLIDECISLFAQMRGCGFTPDETTMAVLLFACVELGNLNVGKWVHSQVIVKGLVVNLQLGTALLNMYSKCGVIDLALQIFERIRAAHGRFGSV